MPADETPTSDANASQARPGKTPAKLSFFCVYNPSLAQSEENTKDQILYYTAEKVVPADVKMKQIGLAQALVNFTSAFKVSHPAQNVHTQKNRMVFLQPEPGFWMYMSVELGIIRKRIRDTKGKEKLVLEYQDTQLNDRALEAVLKVGYEQFKLLNGTFSSILYGGDPAGLPSRQCARSLMHSIEEFFSGWIWKWDFDNLADMTFSAVFNGVPTQPVLRANYLRINKLDQAIHAKFKSAVSHLFVLSPRDNSLVYRSPSLNIKDVRALRRYVSQRLEQYTTRLEGQQQQRREREQALKKDSKMGGLKLFARSLSQSQILSYFTSKPEPSSSTPTSVDDTVSEPVASTLPPPSEIPTAPSSPMLEAILRHGVFLPGHVDFITSELEAEEPVAPQPDIVRVFLSSRSALKDESSDEGGKETQIGGSTGLPEYFLLIYKHESGLVWSFLLNCARPEVEDLVLDPFFYTRLETFMLEQQLDSIVSDIHDNIQSAREKNLSLGKHFRCLYYDNATLDIKSTMTDMLVSSKSKDKPSTLAPMSNEMLLQMLDIKDDFEKLARTSEVYARAVPNYWIAGRRLYNKVACSTAPKRGEGSDNDSDGQSSVDSLPKEMTEDYAEIYLIASKKDTSLADVEENLKKMALSLQDAMQLQ